MTRQVRLMHWAMVMKARTESGQSVRRWCRENGIQEKTYYYWQRKLRESACEQLEKQSLSRLNQTFPMGQ
jgi:transposase-like protein